MKRILVLLVTILTITGCTEDTPPTMYTLSVTSNPTEGGTINPTNGEYEEGTEVTITVTPNLNYEFDKWSGSWSGSESPLTLTMDSDKTLVGNFILIDSDVVLGYSNDDDSLYEINLENGSLTSSHNPSEDLYWDLEYVPSKNKIVSTIDGSKLLILDLESGESSIVTYGGKAIERLVVIKD